MITNAAGDRSTPGQHHRRRAVQLCFSNGEAWKERESDMASGSIITLDQAANSARRQQKELAAAAAESLANPDHTIPVPGRGVAQPF